MLHRTGAFGLAVVVLTWAQFPLWLIGQAPSVYDGARLANICIYSGSIAFTITGMFLGAAGYATLASGVLPRWTGWVANVSAVLCAMCVPAMYVGPVDPSRFYNAGGWGPAIIANFPPLIWFLVVSVWMIRRREPVASLSSRAA